MKVTIDIFADVMCPWCIIGFSQLSKGLLQLEGEISAEVRWRPFELNPDTPAEGLPHAETLARKLGRSVAEVEAMRERVIQAGDAAGYDFRYRGEGETPRFMMWNTMPAHMLLTWTLDTAGADAQTRLMRALYDAHFQLRRNVSDPAVLLELAEGVGLDRADAEAALSDEKFATRVRESRNVARSLNITGVPTMLINDKYIIPGGREPEAYADALRQVVALVG